jgi:3-dehydroquinate dehydratase-2
MRNSQVLSEARPSNRSSPRNKPAIVNPAGNSRSTGPLPGAIAQVSFQVIEVHMSNPVARGLASTILPVCKGSVTGFGLYSYYLALAAAKEIARQA